MAEVMGLSTASVATEHGHHPVALPLAPALWEIGIPAEQHRGKLLATEAPPWHRTEGPGQCPAGIYASSHGHPGME